MKGSVFFVVVIFCATVIEAANFCADDETQVKTRWLFAENIKCVDKIAEVTDFYNEMYLAECQWWQDLDHPPHNVAKTFVTGCFELRNGTTKYKAKICCPGAVTRQRCFTCNSLRWQHDFDVNLWHSEICNHFTSRPKLCQTGEVCQTTLGYNGSNTVSKFCAPKAACESKSSNNSMTCRSGESIPSCTYCCEGPFCNYNTPLPWYSQRKARHGCATSPCWNSGKCVNSTSDLRGYTCSCQPGTWGNNCESWMQMYSPCKNGAYIRRQTTEPYYHCYCKAGYKGVNCTLDYDTCNEQGSTYCFNGGTCFDQGTFGWRCRCANGFVGTHCEIKASTACAHGSKYFLTNSYTLSASLNCTERNKDLSLTSYLSSCRSWMGGNFKEGVNGHVAHVESMTLSNCDRGDEATWYGFGVCCPACLSSPCQNDGWCITAGADYVCQCRIGFEGKNCENKVATCYVSGDPHYGLFDGLQLHYQGVCRYNLASSRDAYPGLPHFRVLAKSERRHDNMHVSYPRYVDVEVFGHTIRLDKGKKVYVDGVLVLPDATFPGFEITNNGRFVRMVTNFSLVVESDGDWLVVVKVPDSFAGKLAGMCGNNDGDPENDWRTSNGTNVKGLPNKYSLIGNSWQVEDPEDAGCVTTDEPDPPECDASMAAEVATTTYCGLLTASDDVFRNCIRGAPELAASYRENCQFDVCANMDNMTSAKRAACGTLEAFSSQCSGRGFGQADWRTAAGCPLACGAGMAYKLSSPACLPTCLRPGAPEECGLPMTEGCVCVDAAAVVVDGQCVAAESCGCTDDNGRHHAVGESWLNDDCSVEFSCVACTSCKRPVGEIRSVNKSCREGYECSHITDVATCQKMAEWSDWLPWSVCSESCGKGVQLRTRQCVKTEPMLLSVDDSECVGASTETRDCVCESKFYAPVDCVLCKKTSNYIGYVANKCDCSRYYQCHLANGEWTAVLRQCSKCLHWNASLLTCSRSDDIQCEFADAKEVTGSARVCDTVAVTGDPAKYKVHSPGGDIVMTCPGGTVFNQTRCMCVTRIASYHTTLFPSATTLAVTDVAVPDEIMCVGFDAGWNGFGATNWVYIEAINVDRQPNSFVDSAAVFDGSGRLEIPRFSNAYGRWNEFAVSLWYKRDSDGGSAVQGLVSNGNCVAEPSIGIKSLPGAIGATLITNGGKASVAGITAADDVWHHVVLSYDGNEALLYVDGTPHSMGLIQGTISQRHCPIVIGELEANESGFVGLIDELCFYENSISAGAVDTLLNVPHV